MRDDARCCTSKLMLIPLILPIVLRISQLTLANMWQNCLLGRLEKLYYIS